MKKSLAIGSFLGVVLTVGAGYYFYGSRVVELSTRPAATAPSAQIAADPAAVEPFGLPLLVEYPGFVTEFKGSDDLIKHRMELRPHSTLEAWDSNSNPAVMPSIRTSSECAIADLAQSISVSSFYADAVKEGKINLIFAGRSVPRCYGVQSNVYVVSDDLVSGKTYYSILGEAKIERLTEFGGAGGSMPMNFIRSSGIEPSDVMFLSNPSLAPIFSAGAGFTVILFRITNPQPVLDPTVIPPFVPGAETIKPDSITRYFVNSTSKPVFVDARDRSKMAAGPTYPGSISAPFISSNPLQLVFQMDFPLELLAGAKYDTRAIPEGRETPIVVYGNDSQDPTPLWMIRYLRLQNYRRVYYVEGGLKAMLKAKPVLPK